MTTFKVIGLVSSRQLTPLLQLFEAQKIPYNVELNTPAAEPERAPKPRKNGSISGGDFTLKLLKSGPLTGPGLAQEFGKDGRSSKSVPNVLFKLKNAGLIRRTKDGYTLTEKGKK